MKLLLKSLIAIAFLATSFQAMAEDAFNNYVADIHLSESRQLRSPEPVIRYTDGDNGVLLKSILDPARVKDMLDIYWQRSKQGGDPSNFPQLMSPILNRYQKAFEARGSMYENEYLDSVEITTIITASSLVMMNSAQPFPLNNQDSSRQSADQVKLTNSLNSMVKGVAELLTAVKRQLATEMRKKVDAGKFSPEGAKRALKLADSLSAPQ
jgi:hypothetical protein